MMKAFEFSCTLKDDADVLQVFGAWVLMYALNLLSYVFVAYVLALAVKAAWS